MSPFTFTSFGMGRRDEVMLVGFEFISLPLILTALLHAVAKLAIFVLPYKLFCSYCSFLLLLLQRSFHVLHEVMKTSCRS